jgi:hypothetical protein
MKFVPTLTLLCACSSAGLPPELVGRLRAPEASVRSSAIFELEESKSPAAAPYLSAALSDPSADVRVSVAMVLSEWDLPEVRSALLRAAVQDPEDQVREWSVQALGYAAHPESLPALHHARFDRSDNVRKAAEKAIGEIDAALQAKDVRYHPPVSVPPEWVGEDRKIYLKAHHDEWTFVVSRTAPTEMSEARLSVPIATICEAPPVVTAGAYAGQEDVFRFLGALRRRCAKEPRAIDEFRQLRESCLKLHPPRPAEGEDK